MDTYGHLFPDSDEITSTALDEIFRPDGASDTPPDDNPPPHSERLRLVE